MSEPTDRDDDLAEDRSAEWLVAYDAALLSGINQVGSAELLPLPDDREDFAQDVACLELLHRVLRPGTTPEQGATLGSGTRSASRPTAKIEIPKKVGRFEVLRELGRGGYGIVLLAVDPNLERRVAIKIPRPEVLVSAVLRERFLREAESAGRLDHPNLVPVFEVGEDGPLWYIAAAYISGGTLSHWVATLNNPLTQRSAAALVAHLADAAQHAHSAGILHRDIKPGNVLMQPEGESGSNASLSSFAVHGFVPRLCDFGLAKLLDTEGDETMTGTLLGTPSYMAPEQATGCTAELSTATDVYGLGAILYELLTGTAPFKGGNSIETLHQVLHEEVIPPHKLRGDIDRDLEAICLKCLEKKPKQRYQTARELALELRRFLAGEPTEARPVRPLERLAKWCRREPAWAALAGVVSSALVLFVGGLLWSNIKIAEALETARQKEKKAADLLYVADVQLAQQAIESHDYGQAEQILKRQIPASGGEDRREFAWRFLWKMLHREESRLPRHPGDVYCLALSPDGSRTVTACRDGFTRVYATSTHRLLTTLGDHHQEVNSVAFSPDGSLLATGADDGRVLLRNSSDYKIVRILEQPANPTGNTVGGLVFAPDGDHLYVAAGNHVHVWNVASGEHLDGSEFQGRSIRSLAISPDGRTLAAVGSDAYLLATESLETLAVITALRDESLYSAYFLFDGRLVLGGTKGRILFYAPGTFERVAAPQSPLNGDVIALGTSADGRYLLAGSADRAIALFDVDAVEIVAFLGGHADRVWDLRCLPNSSMFASAGADGAVKFWRIPNQEYRSNNPLGILESPQWSGETDGFAFSPDGELSALASAGGVELTNQSTGAVLRLPCAATTVVGLHFSPDGRSLFTCERSAVIHQWDIGTGQELAQAQLPGKDLVNSAISPRGDYLAVGLRADRKDRIYLVSWPSGRVVQQLSLGDRTLATLDFTPRGDGLFIASPGELSLHDPHTLQKLHQVRCQAGESVWDIDFLPDGQRMLTADNVPGASIRDARTGEILARLAGHQGSVRNVAASVDGRTAATVCDNNVVRLWDLVTQQSLCEFPDEAPGWKLGLYFSPRGNELVLTQYRSGYAISLWEAEPLSKTTAAPASPWLRPSSSNRTKWPGAFGDRRHVQAAIRGEVNSAAWAPSSDRLIVADDEGRLFEIRPEAEHPARSLPLTFDSPIRFVRFAPDGEKFLTLDAAGQATWWNTDYQALGDYKLEPGIRGIELNADGTKILYHFAGNYRVADANSGQTVWKGEFPVYVHCATWFNDQTVAVSDKNGAFLIRDGKTGELLLEDHDPQAPIVGLCRAPGNGPVAAIHRPRGVSLLDPQSGKKRASLDRFSKDPHWLDSGRLVLAEEDWFDVYDTNDWHVVAALPRTPMALSFLSPDRSRLAAIYGNEVRVIWIAP